jgi:hypothetical protein
MKHKILFASVLFVFAFSCDDDELGNFPSLFSCNSLLGCGEYGDNVPFCTWGFKFGDNNPFSPNGPNVAGPKSGAKLISFKFLDAGSVLKTSLQNYTETEQITEEERVSIRQYISEWSSVADINFIEKASNDATNISIGKAFIPLENVGGYGNPSFLDVFCNQVAGLIILQSKQNVTSRVVVHEMGHVLGLGHVSSENVMNPNNSNYQHLQPGDIAGIQSIYGSK